jgi:DNA-binding NarL/FixJ family response regulator
VTDAPAPIRVLIADDQEVVRAGFAALLDTREDITVVGTARDGRDAIDVATAKRPDVVLMDVRMPVLDGIHATRHLTTTLTPPPRVIVLTTFDLTSTSTTRFPPARAASCSRTSRPSACSTPCGSSRPATRCSPPPSRGA